MEPSQKNGCTLAATTSGASELFRTTQYSCGIYKLPFHAFLIFDRSHLGAWNILHVDIQINKAYGHRCRWLDVMNSMTLLKLEARSLQYSKDRRVIIPVLKYDKEKECESTFEGEHSLGWY